jgi:thiamine biosynthesis lipoprotein ApbE
VSTSGLDVVEHIGGPENVSVDPRSARTLDPGVEQVISATVIAGSAVEAEAWSTALLVDRDTAWLPALQRGCLVRTVTRDRDVQSSRDWNRIFVKNEVVHV